MSVDRVVQCTENAFPRNGLPLRNDRVFQVGLVCDQEAGDDLMLAVRTPPGHGRLTELSDEVDTNIRVSYTPDPGFVGTDEFEVRVLTGRGGGSFALFYPITVIDAASNQPPVCAPVTAALRIGGLAPFDGLCTDADGDAITYRVVSGPQHGTLRWEDLPNGQGVWWYAATAGFDGWDQFTYAASDGRAETQQTVGIQLGEAPAVPVTTPTPAGAPAPVSTPPATPSAKPLPAGVKRARGLVLGPGALAYRTPATASASRPVRVGAKALDVLAVRCTAATGCVLRARIAVLARGRSATALQAQTFTIAPGDLATVRLAVPARARRALRGRPATRAVVRLTLRAAGTTHRDAITLPLGVV